MANGYKKDEIINKLENLKDISALYKEDFINYRGDTTDTKEKYTEVIAEWLIKNNNYFSKKHLFI
ncbi:hypothetical protein EPJ67_02480 [Brachyspira aalborgi]|uniref:Uncharacterized protein n=1 Tax=Brachyspira aalborgi TaxID=29522 RepID=A0A5C8G8N9_9SPIR|nr:hypothetical protein [Brachyspira aalborgi]TXJ58291.1 hypothetical protein EPJ67_02480 [Brachyspira aalborgi]